MGSTSRPRHILGLNRRAAERAAPTVGSPDSGADSPAAPPPATSQVGRGTAIVRTNEATAQDTPGTARTGVPDPPTRDPAPARDPGPRQRRPPATRAPASAAPAAVSHTPAARPVAPKRPASEPTRPVLQTQPGPQAAPSQMSCVLATTKSRESTGNLPTKSENDKTLVSTACVEHQPTWHKSTGFGNTVRR